MTRTTAPMPRERIPYRPSEVGAPGDTLRETLVALDMTQTELAQRSGLSIKHVNQIIQGQASLTHETAITLERITGVPARFWNSLEAQYRDNLSRRREKEQLKRQTSWLDRMPIAALKKRGHITASNKDPAEQLQQALSFFGVAGVEAWEAYWGKPYAAFLQSPSFTPHQGAVAAWLRLGELQAARVHCEPFDRSKLRALLPELRSLTNEPIRTAFPKLHYSCASVGVALLVVDDVAGTRASGATRWVSPTKVIVQLSNRGKRNDKFWFAVFHEIGHVLLHGKKDVFVDDAESSENMTREEQEANNFASRTLIPRESDSQLSSLAARDVPALAKELGIAPGIIAGRVQRERQDYTFGMRPTLFESYEMSDFTAD